MKTLTRALRVLVVDDSKIAQRAFSKILDADPGIEVIGVASDPYEARDRVVELEPDVLTLDVEMPRMDGITFLRKLMKFRPTPVVIVSSITPAGGEVAVRAFAAGAADVLCKPSGLYGLERMQEDLVERVRAAGAVKDPAQLGSRQMVAPAMTMVAKRDLLAIGSSTGGPEALRTVLSGLPASSPPTVIVQHIPQGFSAAMASSLSAATALNVVEASDGMALEAGSAYVAPGDLHLEVKKQGAQLIAKLNSDEPVLRHRPSVDVMMSSVAREVGKRAVGIVLTGMGADGAVGLKAMRDAGARTFAQDEQSSVVFGMPREALENGGAERAVPLSDVPRVLVEALQS